MPPSSTDSSSAQGTQIIQKTANGDSKNAPVANIKISPPPKTKLIYRLLPTISLTVIAGLWSVVGSPTRLFTLW